MQLTAEAARRWTLQKFARQSNLLHRQLLDSDRDIWEDAEHKPEACVQQGLEAG